MKAWRFSEFGDIANMTLGDHPVPEPGEDEVLVKLNYAALNPADRLLVEGRYPGAGDLPLSVGRDGSGTVEHAGPGSPFKTGDPVIILRSEVGITRNGTLAEYVTAPQAVVASLPQGWSLEEGAAAPLVYLTAWKALNVQGTLESGQTVLIDGASGGVGIAAVHLAGALGARVIALSRQQTHRDTLKTLGAHAAIDTTAPDLEEQVRGALGGGGVDVVINNLGGPYIQTAINLANPGCRIMVIGFLAGVKVQLIMAQLLFKQIRIEGVHVGKFTPPQAQDAWNRVVETLDGAALRPLVDRTFPLAQVQEAFAHLAGGHLGKVLIDTTA